MALHKVSGSKLFSCPFHTELNKSIPIGSYFKCYNDLF